MSGRVRAGVVAAVALLGCADRPSTEAALEQWIAPVELLSPRERQVFQRSDAGSAVIQVAGHAPDDLRGVRVRVRLADGADLAPVAATVRDIPGPTQRFDCAIDVPQGGWHALDVVAAHASSPAERVMKHVERFGVGDVFVIAGQSNSTNSGEAKFAAQDDLVSAFDGVAWSVAADPMPGVQDDTQAGSPWPVFGHLVRADAGVPIGIASAGYEGTSIVEWRPGVKRFHTGGPIELYAGLRQRVASARDVRAILWHQGETDAEHGLASARYVEAFEALASRLRAETGCAAPWIVAHTTYLPRTPTTRRAAIRAAQAEIWECGYALPGPDTDDMIGALRHSIDFKHFSRAGLEEHARRWHAAVRRHVYDRSAEPAAK